MDEVKVSFRLKYVVLVVGLVLLVAGAIVYSKYVPNATILEVVAIAGAGVALLALIYSAMNHHQNTQIHLEMLRIRKIEQSVRIVEQFGAPEMAPYIRTCIELRKQVAGAEPRAIYDTIESKTQNHDAVVAVLNFFEALGIVVRMGGADERLLREYFSPVVHRYWNSLHEWIFKKRGELGSQDLFSELEFLVRRWSK